MDHLSYKKKKNCNVRSQKKEEEEKKSFVVIKTR